MSQDTDANRRRFSLKLITLKSINLKLLILKPFDTPLSLAAQWQPCPPQSYANWIVIYGTKISVEFSNDEHYAESLYHFASVITLRSQQHPLIWSYFKLKCYAHWFIGWKLIQYNYIMPNRISRISVCGLCRVLLLHSFNRQRQRESNLVTVFRACVMKCVQIMRLEHNLVQKMAFQLRQHLVILQEMHLPEVIECGLSPDPFPIGRLSRAPLTIAINSLPEWDVHLIYN